MEMLTVQLIGNKTKVKKAKVKKAIGPSKKKVTLTQLKDAYTKVSSQTTKMKTPEQASKNRALKIKKITKFIADLKSAGYDKKTKTGPILLNEMVKYKKKLEKESKTSVKITKEKKVNIPKDLQIDKDKKLLEAIIKKSNKKFTPVKKSNIEMYISTPEKQGEPYQVISVVLRDKYSASGKTKAQAISMLLKQLEEDFK